MSENYTQTVAAVSTPHGRGGVAMIRISGPDSAEIIDRVFVPAGKASPGRRAETRGVREDCFRKDDR